MRRRDAISLLAAVGILDANEASSILIDLRTRKRISSLNVTGALALPGSTIKPFALAGLLKRGRVRAEESWPCPGKLMIAGRNLSCAHPLLPSPVTVGTALAYSCNCFVAHVAERYRAGELAADLAVAGFSHVVPAQTLDATRLQALGEDGIQVTLEELAAAYAGLATATDPAIRGGLEDAVAYGTAQRAAVAGVTVAGKTGSVRTAAGSRIAWFAGFTSEVAVAVMVPGQSGGSDAAPVAGRLLAEWAQAIRLPGRKLPLERYVAAVLAGEAGILQSDEALKAMAVAARTYAIRLRGRHASEGYDFCTTTHCQRAEPGGVTPRLEAAVAATAGELLWYRGKPAFTPYSRDCGGRTEDAAAVWPDLAAPYLKCHNDPHCPRDPWQWHADPAKVADALRRAGLRAPRVIEGISIAQRTASDRAAILVLRGSGEAVRISASSFRFAVGRSLGWSSVPSDRYEISGLDFHGFGSGHGVGLCQHGADRMGAAGSTYRDILAFYYPGAAVGQSARGIPWQTLSGESITLLTTEPGRDREVLAIAERELRVASDRTGWPAPRGIEIRVYPDLDTYRDATGAAGWIAGFTKGRRIHLQRLPRKETVRHELLHVLVESQAAARLPLWFREGVVEYLESPTASGGTARVPSDAELSSNDAGRVRTARADAARMVASLVNRHGEGPVLGWLTRGLPAGL
jgi:stage II sporulation protein D